MDEQITLREAVKEDIDLVFDFIHKLAEHENRPQDMTASKEQIASLIFDKGPAKVLLAFYEKRAVGFAVYFPVISTFSGSLNYYIEDLFVLADMRGFGIGRKIIDKLRTINGIDGIKLTCLMDNDDGLNFYDKIGAKKGLPSYPFFLSRLN